MLPLTEVPLILVGCNHELQIEKPGSCYEPAQEAFRKRLDELIEHYSVKFIGEEADPSAESIAQAIARERKLRYLNIDIPKNCKADIKHVLPKKFNDSTNEWEDQLETNRYAKAWNLVREYHMYKVVKVQLTDEPSLLIVGKLHIKPLMELGFAGFKTYDLTPS